MFFLRTRSGSGFFSSKFLPITNSLFLSSSLLMHLKFESCPRLYGKHIQWFEPNNNTWYTYIFFPTGNKFVRATRCSLMLYMQDFQRLIF